MDVIILLVTSHIHSSNVFLCFLLQKICPICHMLEDRMKSLLTAKIHQNFCCLLDISTYGNLDFHQVTESTC